jgi:hypothetical protein
MRHAINGQNLKIIIDHTQIVMDENKHPQIHKKCKIEINHPHNRIPVRTCGYFTHLNLTHLIIVVGRPIKYKGRRSNIVINYKLLKLYCRNLNQWITSRRPRSITACNYCSSRSVFY